MISPDQFIDELWDYANQVPMVEHPWFKGIVDHRWTRGQIVLGEVQHYLRVRTNPIYFGYMAVNAVANLILIPLWGAQGAALATGFSFVFGMVVLRVYVRRLLGIRL